MKLKLVASVVAVVLAISCLGCESKKKTRKLTLEGPETKTELKLETTKKGDKND